MKQIFLIECKVCQDKEEFMAHIKAVLKDSNRLLTIKEITNPNSGALDREIIVSLINKINEERYKPNPPDKGYNFGAIVYDALIERGYLLPKQEIKYPTEPQIGDMLHKENLLGCGRPYLTADRTIDLIKSLNP